jgi:hypothetical protein
MESIKIKNLRVVKQERKAVMKKKKKSLNLSTRNTMTQNAKESLQFSINMHWK